MSINKLFERFVERYDDPIRYESGPGYSQQTMDAVSKERDGALCEVSRLASRVSELERIHKRDMALMGKLVETVRDVCRSGSIVRYDKSLAKMLSAYGKYTGDHV